MCTTLGEYLTSDRLDCLSSFRPRISHCKGRSVSADLLSVSYSRSATTLFCASWFLPFGFCLTCDPQRTDRQTVLGRTDVHDNAATGDSPIRRHHSQPRHHCRHHHCYLVGRMVRHTAPSVIVAWLSLLHRLRRSYPDFLNTSGLLVDVVSVMGNILHYLIQCVKE